jgi:hypothetical protein
MHMDVWYDLAVRELSDRSMPARELLKDAAKAVAPKVVREEEEKDEDR